MESKVVKFEAAEKTVPPTMLDPQRKSIEVWSTVLKYGDEVKV